jgi:epoxyqueuosine reductase
MPELKALARSSPPGQKMISSDQLKRRASELGFDLCGVAPADNFPELQRLAQWIANGHHAGMEYMARTADRRRDVRHVLPAAKSVISVGMIYNVDRPYSTQLADSGNALIARYAWGDDYHEVMREPLEALERWLHEQSGVPVETRVYVDTGPVQERVYAQYAGLGWIGKNTCLINADLGSWIFLGEIICSLPLEPDAPALDQCGTCTLCLEACPTGAFTDAWALDSNRCISYLTIENKGDIPPDLRPFVGSHVYGCDICQEVCPWNGAPPVSDRAAWLPRAPLDRPRIAELSRRSDDELRAALKGSAMKRAGVRRLRRNIGVALENTGGDA